jgi:hypothetical protein
MLNIKMDKAALTVLDLPFSPFIDLFWKFPYRPPCCTSYPLFFTTCEKSINDLFWII